MGYVKAAAKQLKVRLLLSYSILPAFFTFKRSVDVAPFLEITYVKFVGICFQLSHIPLFGVCESLPFSYHKSPSLTAADHTPGFS